MEIHLKFELVLGPSDNGDEQRHWQAARDIVGHDQWGSACIQIIVEDMGEEMLVEQEG